MAKTIALVGGGSGGHITPLLAVAAELKQQAKTARIVYIGQKGDQFLEVVAQATNIDEVLAVRAGKFRRYHGEGPRQLLDIKTMLLNLRDFFYVLVGLVQSRRLLKTLQPDVIFIKGGFVGVPVGLAAANLKIPYITHDSDAIPGLANRIISRWAAKHAVALPKDVYAYPTDKTVTTGIPLQADFVPVTAELQKKYRTEIEVPASAKLLFVIGGGLGSQRVNQAVTEAVPHLLAEFNDLHAVHVSGRANEAGVQKLYKEQLSAEQLKRVRVFSYLTDVYRYSGAADVVVTRAGATNLAEFALQGKACVVLPSPFLTGGHQLKNAEALAHQGAAVVIPEDELARDSNRLASRLSRLFHDSQQRIALSHKITQFAKSGAATELAKLILEQAR